MTENPSFSDVFRGGLKWDIELKRVNENYVSLSEIRNQNYVTGAFLSKKRMFAFKYWTNEGHVRTTNQLTEVSLLTWKCKSIGWI